jgi:mannose-6-phosphate isomerase-like protein (cupin superfamily)
MPPRAAADHALDPARVSDAVIRTENEATSEANGGPLHRHLRQEERFIVHEGVLRVRRGLRGVHLVGPGEEITIPPGTPHTFRVDAERARVTAEFTQPLRVADLFLELPPKSSLRDFARLAREYPQEYFYLPVVPPTVRRALLRPLA